MPPSPTISFHTLGCRLNQSETAVIQNSFKARDYRVVNFEEAAEIVVINTCTVTENGDEDTRRLVNKIHRRNAGAKIALIGCQAQIQKARLSELPNVKWVIGNAEKMDLVRIIHDNPSPVTPQVLTPAIPRTRFTIPIAGVDPLHTRANIKIQDGCDFFCSFCEIPYARGRARSREFSDVVREARALTAAGHKELVVTGINVGTYRDGEHGFMDVIDALQNVPDLFRLRISSIEPTTVPWPLIETMKSWGKHGKVCRYLHLPLQSGHDDILAAMKRKYTVGEFQDFIRKVIHEIPDVCIGTDVIVGFPGETDAHFEATYDVLLDAPVHYFHVFSYSRRPTAQSRRLSDPIPSDVIHERSRRLRELSQRKRRVYYESMCGTTAAVLFEERKGDAWTGVTDNYIRVKVASDRALANELLPVKLLGIDDSAMSAELM